MPKAKSPAKIKTIVMLVVGLAIGIAATFGGVYWYGQQAQEKNKQLLQNEQQMIKLAPKVQQSMTEMAKLADQGKIDDAKALGEQTLATVDQIMDLNQTLIDGTKDKPQELSRKKQELFQLQKQLVQKLIAMLDVKNPNGAEAKQLQQEFKDIADQMQQKSQEIQDFMVAD